MSTLDRLRSTFLVVGLAAGVALAGCGPSAQVREARAARYAGDRAQVFDTVAQALGEEETIDRADPQEGAFITRVRWFASNGASEHWTEVYADGEYHKAPKVKDGAIRLAYIVRVVGVEASSYQVVVEPSVDQYRAGYTALYHMKLDDPAMPGWVGGKVENLQVALHQRLERKLAASAGASP